MSKPKCVRTNSTFSVCYFLTPRHWGDKNFWTPTSHLPNLAPGVPAPGTKSGVRNPAGSSSGSDVRVMSWPTVAKTFSLPSFRLAVSGASLLCLIHKSEYFQVLIVVKLRISKLTRGNQGKQYHISWEVIFGSAWRERDLPQRACFWFSVPTAARPSVLILSAVFHSAVSDDISKPGTLLRSSSWD